MPDAAAGSRRRPVTRLALLVALVLGSGACESPRSAAPDAPPPEAPSSNLGPSPMPSAALDPTQVLSRIALGSCFAPQLGDDEIWDRVLAAEPDLLLLLGDNVYQSEEKGEPELLELKEAYALLAGVEPFARLRESTPVMVVWDDHDYGLNDAGGDFVAKHESEELFERVWAVPEGDPRRGRDGIYTAVTVGPPGRRVQIVLLDTRFFRSPLKPTDEKGTLGKERYLPDDDPAKTMLGEEQWAWLAETLRQPAELRIVASSVQVVADGHGWEGWFALPRERRRLYELIAETGAPGVVFVSGDRHAAGFYRAPPPAPFAIPELTSSSLNFPITGEDVRARQAAEAGPHRVGDLYGEANFGMIRVDWEARLLTFEIRGADGEVVREWRVPMAELSPSGG